MVKEMVKHHPLGSTVHISIWKLPSLIAPGSSTSPETCFAWNLDMHCLYFRKLNFILTRVSVCFVACLRVTDGRQITFAVAEPLNPDHHHHHLRVTENVKWPQKAAKYCLLHTHRSERLFVFLSCSFINELRCKQIISKLVTLMCGVTTPTLAVVPHTRLIPC